MTPESPRGITVTIAPKGMVNICIAPFFKAGPIIQLPAQAARDLAAALVTAADLSEPRR